MQLALGLLGAARITPGGIVAPARVVGARLVSIAARDPQRARDFAREHGVERAARDYAELIADPEVNAVYIALVNSEHARWAVAAAAAGRHVLCEKPFAANAAEARIAARAAREAGVVLSDGSHFVHHPLTRRLHELLAAGEIGEVRHVETRMVIPAPPASDPRWSLELAGGGLMDLGCYSLRALRGLTGLLGGEPRAARATAVERAGAPGVDERVEVDLEFPSGATARLLSRMSGEGYDMAFVVHGSRGTIELGNFALPHLDPRLTVVRGAHRRVEDLGAITSYTHQLDAFRAAVLGGAPLATDADDGVATMELVDACYRAAGLPVRPGRLEPGGGAD